MVANSTAVHSAEILGEKAPGVAAALQAMRRSGHGLALSDVVGTIAAIEHLVVEDSVGVLAHAYAANGLETAAELGEADLHEVLRSYLLLFRYSEGAEVDQQEPRAVCDDASRAIAAHRGQVDGSLLMHPGSKLREEADFPAQNCSGKAPDPFGETFFCPKSATHLDNSGIEWQLPVGWPNRGQERACMTRWRLPHSIVEGLVHEPCTVVVARRLFGSP